MVVVPVSAASTMYSSLLAVGIVFGTPAAVLVGMIFIGFFIIVAIIYNVTFARILFVSALDHRLPTSLALVNRYHTPARAIFIQTIIVGIIAALTYFIGPLFYPEEGANFSFKVYNVSQAATTISWCISMIILFLDLSIFLVRFKDLFAKKRDQLIAPPWILYVSSGIGGIASAVASWVTLTESWNANLIPNSQWWIIVGSVVLVSLIIGLLGSAYPRLLSSLDEQTAAARENARLYSELRTAYARLSELDRIKDAFLMTASHELRTPLTIVQGYLELLGEMQEEDIDPEMRRAFVNKARRACDELVLLQANIMDASRLEFEAADLHLTKVSLKEICTNIMDLFEPLIVQEKRHVEVDIAENLTVWADESRLKQVLRNLIANALRYSPPRSPIRISATVLPEEHMVRTSVIDRGFGVPPDKQHAIFDRFVRLERDMHGSARGSGLGLAITRHLVEAMQGKITVESIGVDGEGSTFSFTLPMLEAP